MKILAGEIALREETRGIEQAKPQMLAADFAKQSQSLADTQDDLADRVVTVIEDIVDLPDGESNFGKEIGKLANAGNAMSDAVEFLATPSTGPDAIGAETEAIEWLLQAKRSKKGGGKGGGNPGGGNRSGVDSNIAALALLGNSNDSQSKVVEKEVQQATGTTGTSLPEEYQRGLGQYFELLEKRK